MKAKEARKLIRKSPAWGEDGGIGKQYALEAIKMAEKEITDAANEVITDLIRQILEMEKVQINQLCPTNHKPTNGKMCYQMECEKCKSQYIAKHKREMLKNINFKL